MNKGYLNFATDMADERVDTYKKVHNLSDINGIKVESNDLDILKITTVDVLNENGVAAVKKEMGRYITIELKEVEYLEENEKQKVITEIAKCISELIGQYKKILVVGIGNEEVTPDALGPKVISYIEITRHIIKYLNKEAYEKEISAIVPGVLANTGIETEEIVESVVTRVNPDAVIVIDSLASMSVDRVGKTIQIGNTGLTPGAGVKNKRKALNEHTLKRPVVAIGVPTVVDMATITNEAIDKLIESIKEEMEKYPSHNTDFEKVTDVFNMFETESRYNMIANTLDTKNYMVTPKEIDSIIFKISEIIASSINKAI